MYKCKEDIEAVIDVDIGGGFIEFYIGDGSIFYYLFRFIMVGCNGFFYFINEYFLKNLNCLK